MITYDENLSVDFGQGINQANSDYRVIHGVSINDGGMTSVMSQRAAWDYYVGGLTWEQSKYKHWNEYRDVYGLPHVSPPTPPPPGPVPPFPSVPTRDQMGNVFVGFQGEMVDTQQYGRIPVFGPETTTLNDDDLHSYCQQLRGRGYTHGEIAISWQYDEPTFHYPVPGRDLTNDLDELARRIRIMISHFPGGVVLFLAGDGRSNPPTRGAGVYNYNDPQGWTYGHEWLMDNLPRIVKGLVNSKYGDVTPYVTFCPGYDGVFYGWGGDTDGIDRQPQRVVDYGNLLRSLLPQCVSAIEHDTGHIPVGEGGSDWSFNGRMLVFDVVLSEFNWWTPGTPAGDSVWQIVGRLWHPYNRPADQPAGDDPNPPFYLGTSTPRGKVFYVPYEYATYQWVRQLITSADVSTQRAYLRALGPMTVC
jgi:hypothetical protein